MPPIRITKSGSMTAPIMISSAVLVWTNYQLYTVYNGTHPWISPKLEAAGILPGPKATTGNEEDKGDEGWTNVNGMPVPSFDTLMRPFRKA